MKSQRKVERFDYSKYESSDAWDYETLREFEFWGFHKKGDRIHIDTKRYKKPCYKVGITDFLPKGLFKQRSTVYFGAARIKRTDYKVNIFRDFIYGLEKQWNEEYKPLFSKIKTPDDVYKNVRMNSIVMTSDTDDLMDIEVDAKMAAYRRMETCNKVMNELYCMFIQKITTEIDRVTLIFMVDSGYKGTDFSFENFLKFTEDKLKTDKSLDFFKSLNGYNCYTLLHKINNFLKHNSRESYKTLLYMFPQNVKSVKNGTSKEEYQNGMFAGDWIILKPGYLDKVYKKLIGFFEDYCLKVMDEDTEESKWNYDEYFLNAYYEMRDPQEYCG